METQEMSTLEWIAKINEEQNIVIRGIGPELDCDLYKLWQAATRQYGSATKDAKSSERGKLEVFAATYFLKMNHLKETLDKMKPRYTICFRPEEVW